jgi:hypothetical protein
MLIPQFPLNHSLPAEHNDKSRRILISISESWYFTPEYKLYHKPAKGTPQSSKKLQQSRQLYQLVFVEQTTDTRFQTQIHIETKQNRAGALERAIYRTNQKGHRYKASPGVGGV